MGEIENVGSMVLTKPKTLSIDGSRCAFRLVVKEKLLIIQMKAKSGMWVDDHVEKAKEIINTEILKLWTPSPGGFDRCISFVPELGAFAIQMVHMGPLLESKISALLKHLDLNMPDGLIGI